MNPVHTKIVSVVRNPRSLVLLGALAGLLATVGCSDDSKNVVKAAQPANDTVKAAALKTDNPQPKVDASVEKTASTDKSSQPKLLSYKSRDYGISFLYPWQYSQLSARSIVTEDLLKPASDGYEGQFSLVRIEVPKGFYPDTNFDRGYFTLSLNQDVSKEECESSLGEGDLSTHTINGIDFRAVENETGGHGSSIKTRNYVTYANDTCYEMELGVKTKNDDGLAREVNPDQVLRRLESILATVKIAAETPKSMATQVDSSNNRSPAIPQN